MDHDMESPDLKSDVELEPGPGSNVGPDVGPKVTLKAIEENIAEEHYALGMQLASAAGQYSEYASMDTLTICTLVLKNGFTVVGTSACADPSNFDVEIGRKIAKQNAVNQIWPLMGYELRTKLMEFNKGSDIDDALTRLMALSLGNPEAFRTSDAKAILAQFVQDKSKGIFRGA